MKHCPALSTGLSLIASLLLVAPVQAGPSLFSAEGYRLSPTPAHAHAHAHAGHARALDALSVQRLLNEAPRTPPADAGPRQWRYTGQNHFSLHQHQAVHGDKGRPLVFYCGADCRFAWNASKRAHSPGYRDSHWYRDGIDGWQQAGLPLIPAQPLVMP